MADRGEQGGPHPIALSEGLGLRGLRPQPVGHDLRTPLASIKASVSTLRQTDVEWTDADEAALLATIENSADRLDALIGNLLDMSRLTTGSLQPFLRATAIDEVAPVALRGLDGGSDMHMAVPDGLPLVLTDPGLLERVLEDFERCGAVGEEANKKVSYLAAVSRMLPKPLAVVVQSSSSAGVS